MLLFLLVWLTSGRPQNFSCIEGNTSEYLAAINAKCVYAAPNYCAVIKILPQPLGFSKDAYEIFGNYHVMVMNKPFNTTHPFGVTQALDRAKIYFRDKYCSALMNMMWCNAWSPDEAIRELNRACIWAPQQTTFSKFTSNLADYFINLWNFIKSHQELIALLTLMSIVLIYVTMH